MTKIYICYYGITWESGEIPLNTLDKAMAKAREALDCYEVSHVIEYTLTDGEYVDTGRHKITKTSFNPRVIQGGK